MRPCAVCVVLPRLEDNCTPDDGFDSLCFLDTQGKCTRMVHEISCPGVGCAGNDAFPERSLCAHIMRLILSAKGLSLT